MPAFSETLRVYVDQTLSPSAISAALATAARAALADAVQSGQASPEYTRYVDGREGVDEDQARQTILYQFNYMPEVAAFALSFLQSRSPDRSGEYRNSFYVGVNGRFIPQRSFAPASVPWDAEVVIGNTQPQSRKIDVQLDGSRVLHFSVPAGLFDDAASAVKRRFNGLVTVKRVYTQAFPGQYVLRRSDKRGTPVQSPTLVMRAVS